MKLKFDHFQFNQTVQNGIPIQWKHIPWINDFLYIRIAFIVGGRQDPVGKEGLAHFFEHLPFNGCEGYSTKKNIDEVDRNLFQDTLGACTNFDRTLYHAKVSNNNLSEAINFLKSFLFSPTLDQNETERERGVIIQELWRSFESPKKEELIKKLQKMKYGEHPFARQKRVLGWYDSIKNITFDDLLLFHNKHYRSGNVIIVLVGDITEETLKKMEQFTGSLPKGKSIEPIPLIKSWPRPKVTEFSLSLSEYFGLDEGSVPQKTNVGIFTAIPQIKNSRCYSVARSILRKLLFDRIRGELGATYSPRVAVDNFQDHSSFCIDLEISPGTLQSVKKIVSESINELASENPQHQNLFSEIKEIILKNTLHYDSSADDIADDALEEWIDTGRIKSLQEDCTDIRRVTYKDVAELFSQHFNPDQLFWTILTP